MGVETDQKYRILTSWFIHGPATATIALPSTPTCGGAALIPRTDGAPQHDR